MAENVNVTPPPAPPSGDGNGGLYFVVGAILAVVLVGGFLLFGNPTKVGPDVASPAPVTTDRNINVTIERPKAPAPAQTAPAAPAPAAPAPARQ
jgi:hypothetical protein